MSRSSEAAVETPQRARVLIVEDEPLSAEDLRTVLVDAGLEISGVAARSRDCAELKPPAKDLSQLQALQVTHFYAG